MADDDKLLVVPLGQESKILTQTISNDTAMQIMGLMADGPMSTSAVAEKLSIPLTTAQYNIEKLMEAGLVKVEKTKYSEKGREVKLYRASRRYIILVPEKTGGQAVIDALKKYLMLVPVVAAVSVVVEYLVPSPYAGQMQAATYEMGDKGAGQPLLSGAPASTNYSAVGSMNSIPMPVPTVMPTEAHRTIAEQVSQALSTPFYHAGLLFFAGCMLVIFLLVVLEYARHGRLSWLKK